MKVFHGVYTIDHRYNLPCKYVDTFVHVYLDSYFYNKNVCEYIVFARSESEAAFKKHDVALSN